jgi:hypothetical protein
MARKTPPLHAKGVYTLRTPWSSIGDTLYECIAIRSIDDFVERGENVYNRFYAPKGLTQTEYNDDVAQGVHIVTLQSTTSVTIFVPDTYIDAFPDLTSVAYKRIVLSLELGPLPDTVDLAHLKASVGAVASDITGVEAVVIEHVAPYAGVISADQHALNEASRLAAISNRTTDRARVVQQQVVIDAQTARIQALEQLVRQLQPSP